ncbi:hypothetical protein PR048_019291 [Dryococelus australis]|uniref:Uncharacterized protein n=1 Tax=Dryococelus australis TaxID=614101 RepID=A0ABQ9H3F3_9NEOP|nr:hypothetical protein PR048_019291 [Dryococelus australis]
MWGEEKGRREIEKETRVKRYEYGAAPECKGEGKQEIAEKARRPEAPSGTIPTREDPGETARNRAQFAQLESEQ